MSEARSSLARLGDGEADVALAEAAVAPLRHLTLHHLLRALTVAAPGARAWLRLGFRVGLGLGLGEGLRLGAGEGLKG
jgi:hypothetical protein